MEIPRHWRLRAQRYRLEGSFCPGCGKPAFPPRQVCPYCKDQPVRILGYGLQIIPSLSRIIATVSVERMIR